MITSSPADLLNWNPEELDPQAIYAGAEHAIAAYAGDSEYRRAAKDAGFTDAAVFEKDGVQVAMAYHKGLMVISPQGSSELRDWWDDVRSFRLVPWYFMVNGRAGKGFVRQFRKARTALASGLIEQNLNFAAFHTVVVNGHSLGGILAPMLAWSWNSPCHRTRCLIYEGPRGFDAYTTERYDEEGPPTWTIVNTSAGLQDPVTRFHLRRWGFRHVAGHQRLLLNGRQGAQLGREAWLRHRLSNPTPGWAPYWRPITRLFQRGKHLARAHMGDHLLGEIRAWMAAGAPIALPPRLGP